MRQTSVICDRCKSPVGSFSVIEATAGAMRQTVPSPIDLCEGCSDRLLDWLRAGHPDLASQDGPGEALSSTVVSSMALA